MNRHSAGRGGPYAGAGRRRWRGGNRRSGSRRGKRSVKGGRSWLAPLAARGSGAGLAGARGGRARRRASGLGAGEIMAAGEPDQGFGIDGGEAGGIGMAEDELLGSRGDRKNNPSRRAGRGAWGRRTGSGEPSKRRAWRGRGTRRERGAERVGGGGGCGQLAMPWNLRRTITGEAGAWPSLRMRTTIFRPYFRGALRTAFQVMSSSTQL